MNVFAKQGQKRRDAMWSVCPTSLYVHIPFCQSRCFYCDFNTYVAPPSLMESYTEALVQELAWLGKEAQQPLQTVFFGGGTPTRLPIPLLKKVLAAVRAYFPLAPDVEWTVEANPGSADVGKLETLLEAGVNRISFGAQTFSERLLMSIGRIHNVDDIASSVERAQSLGFQRINLDLMFGLPEQSKADVEESVKCALSLHVRHISAYWLKVEEGTPFFQWQAADQLPLPGEDAEADMYGQVRELLESAYLRQYEISNFAERGAEARHNLVYWRNEPFFAAGAGAHGNVNGTRYENVSSLLEYCQMVANGRLPHASAISETYAEAAETTMILGLRLRDGISLRRFEERFSAVPQQLFGEVWESLFQQGYLQQKGDFVSLPLQYWAVSNEIFEKFVATVTED